MKLPASSPVPSNTFLLSRCPHPMLRFPAGRGAGFQGSLTLPRPIGRIILPVILPIILLTALRIILCRLPLKTDPFVPLKSDPPPSCFGHQPLLRHRHARPRSTAHGPRRDLTGNGNRDRSDCRYRDLTCNRTGNRTGSKPEPRPQTRPSVSQTSRPFDYASHSSHTSLESHSTSGPRNQARNNENAAPANRAQATPKNHRQPAA